MAQRFALWLVLGAVLAGAGAGCVGGLPAEDEGVDSRSGEIETVYLDATLDLGEREVASPGASPSGTSDEPPGGDVCACESQACIDAWTSENFGCDVCVVVPCQQTSDLHACHFCDE